MAGRTVEDCHRPIARIEGFPSVSFSQKVWDGLPIVTESARSASLQLDALAAQRGLRQRIIDLATSYRPLRDQRLMKLCQEAWAGDERDPRPAHHFRGAAV
jgi:hypothetical protein